MMPDDLPPWQTVYDHFSRWSKRGVWEVILDHLNHKARGITQVEAKLPVMGLLMHRASKLNMRVKNEGLIAVKK
jgi:putative transposase